MIEDDRAAWWSHTCDASLCASEKNTSSPSAASSFSPTKKKFLGANRMDSTQPLVSVPLVLGRLPIILSSPCHAKFYPPICWAAASIRSISHRRRLGNSGTRFGSRSLQAPLFSSTPHIPHRGSRVAHANGCHCRTLFPHGLCSV
ncbi:hypothetical protein, variant [Verruconis gallopava]|uniref:Uncharacterized protein n=1 Tax=Verruconis gallopava TaxID=253628 RepID=A0A0D1YZ40_9PEZI|nr:uncharacterized protein PV09_03143 [Verruconis gallopava]XP_016215827.1 hypothetical protein, variant [Verruconis gallopava]KIW05957.1 hypothetical protein PV09_03143 [Verruconis gallopava]KIW05958.1 hypothetical protein, variant [Verruconis gallopava]